MPAAADDAAAERLLPDSINSLELSTDGGAPLATAAAPFQSRAQTIASIVNTMMGTTILALPLGMSQSGIGAGLVVTGLLGALSCATCLIVVERGLAAGHSDFSGSVGALLGRRAQLVAWTFSVAIILGASIVYHILMQETLFALVNTVAAARGGGGGGAPVVAVATLPAGASPFRADGAFQLVTGGSPMLSGLGGMVRGRPPLAPRSAPSAPLNHARAGPPPPSPPPRADDALLFPPQCGAAAD